LKAGHVNGIRQAILLLLHNPEPPISHFLFAKFGFSFVVMANASRTDLLAWLNELLQINYTKVEQCGTGGAYCQVLDSIYGKNHRVVTSHRPCFSLTLFALGTVSNQAIYRCRE
jgi:hypothetical protein